MSTGRLTIDLDAIAANWRALDSACGGRAAAVVKADGYGCHAPAVARRLLREGVRTFFVAVAEEGAEVRRAVGPGPDIFIFSGPCPGDEPLIAAHALIPLINSPAQARDVLGTDQPFGVQLDSGMNRLGLEPAEFAALKDAILAGRPQLLISHLACADTPEHRQNAAQLRAFITMTEGTDVPRSLAATGGIMLGPDYHLDMTRPGVGLYGGHPFAGARAVLRLDLPVIQTRTVAPGEAVGYGMAWRAVRPSVIATVAAGYADGLLRAMGGGTLRLFADDIPCPLVGRVSMDLITADVTDAADLPRTLTLLNHRQTVDDLAQAAGTIGHEILTSLGSRYARLYKGA
ncbi:MAG: alanine racemase [Rhodobacteraceae bacterium]|nr:alanine racemase [Paracoccaceae bacterium]